MAEYVAPLKDMKFVLKHVVGLVQVNELPGWEEVTEDLVDAILEEAGKLATELLSPLNAQGDRQGAKRFRSAPREASYHGDRKR